VADYVSCKHCSSTGTCKNAQDRRSCAVCREHWKEKWLKTYQKSHEATPELKDLDSDGLVCSVCEGLGVVEMQSSSWDYRFPGYLAIIFIFAAFGLIFYFYNDKGNGGFQQVLVFASTLIGSVTGYYFGGAKRTGRTVEPPANRP